MEISSILAESNLGRGLSPEQLDTLAQISRLQEVEPGQLLIEEGSPGEDIYVLGEGRLSVEVQVPLTPQESMELYTGKRGEIFGEISFLDGSPRSASVRAKTRATVLVIDGKRLKELMERDLRLNSAILHNLALVLCSRLRSIDLQLRNVLSER